MGEYGIYVWPAYGITLGVFLWNVLCNVWTTQKIKKKLARNYSHES